MATFVSTIKFTEKGVKSIAESPQRATALKTAAKKMGVKVKEIYWTLGEHDGVFIFDAPDDETATALMLHLGSLGNVQTSTSRAFTANEMKNVLAKMGGE